MNSPNAAGFEQGPDPAQVDLRGVTMALRGALGPTDYGDGGNARQAHADYEGVLLPAMWLGYVPEAQGYDDLARTSESVATMASRNDDEATEAAFTEKAEDYEALAEAAATLAADDKLDTNRMVMNTPKK